MGALSPSRLPQNAVLGAACLALAALSLLIPSAPTTDPWGWITWGHELVFGGFSTVMGGAPSWKPLPVLITTPLALAGDSAPGLWLLVARAAGLFSLVVAYRLAGRFEGPAAGVLAAAGLVLSGNWVRSLAHGYSEPLSIGLLLASVIAHLDGHERRALVLGTLTALVRPEAFPLVVVYAVVLLRRRRVGWALAAALVASVPALWIVPDWIGSGRVFHANQVARQAIPARGLDSALHTMLEAALITPAPLTVCALAAMALGRDASRRAVRRILGLAGGWAALLALLLLAGYPQSDRFFVLPAALICVVGAVGAVALVRSPGSRVLAPALAGTIAVAAVARGIDAGHAAADSVRRAQLERELATAVERVGPAALRRCGRPLLPGGLSWLKGQAAFEIGVRPVRVRSIRTSARGYVDSLAGSGEERLPLRPRTVSVWLPRRSGVLLLPFGGAAVRSGGGPLRVLASAGPWRVMAPAGRSRCTSAV